MDKMPPIAALRAFEAASRTGSLTRAAEELNVTYSAVAQQLRRLEAWLEMPLMQRKGRGMELLPEARAFAEQLNDGFETIRTAVRDQVQHRQSGPLRIGTTPGFAKKWLLPRLHRFSDRNPGTGFSVEPGVCCDGFDLRKTDYDLAFVYGDGNFEGVETELVALSRSVLIGSRDIVHKLGDRSPFALSRAPWVREQDCALVVDWFRDQGLEVSPEQIIDLPTEYAMTAIESGQGIGWATTIWLEDRLETGELVELAEQQLGPNAGYYLCYRDGAHRPYLKAFLNWVRDEIAVHEPA